MSSWEMPVRACLCLFILCRYGDYEFFVLLVVRVSYHIFSFLVPHKVCMWKATARVLRCGESLFVGGNEQEK